MQGRPVLVVAAHLSPWRVQLKLPCRPVNTNCCGMYAALQKKHCAIQCNVPLIVFLLPTGCMWCCCPRPIPSVAGGLDPKTLPVFRPVATRGRVVKVIDGDSVWVAVREHGLLVRLSVRLQGIDTPELRSKCPAERQRAQEARGALAALVHDRNVRIEHHGPDKYGRHLARLLLGRRDVNTAMLENGLARPYTGGRRAPFTCTARVSH